MSHSLLPKLLFIALWESNLSIPCKHPVDDVSTNFPAGIQTFSEIFNLHESELLSTLKQQVIANQCNFGDPSISSSIFSFASGYTNLHCGAFGAAPKYVVRYKDHIRDVLYSRPHLWDDVNSTFVMNILRSEIAEYLGIPNSDDLVFTINASHGLMAILRSLMDHFLSQYLIHHNQSNNENSDLSEYGIIYFNTGHGAYISPLKHYHNLYNITWIEVQFTADSLKDYNSIINTINDTLRSYNDSHHIIFGVFSHITSLPSLILPLNDIISLFHDYNITTIVDGAHAMGQIEDLQLGHSDVDIYISNAYKWFYSPWNTAVIYVKPSYQHIIKPPAIGYGENASFQELFHHPGTVDESAYLSMMGSLEFRRLIGGDRNIIDYIHTLAIQTQVYLAELWNTSLFSENTDHFVGMVNVELPSIEGVEMNKEVIDRIFYSMLEDQDIAIKLFQWNGKFYIRVSCQIYNDMTQIERVGALILDYLNAEVIDTAIDSKDEL